MRRPFADRRLLAQLRKLPLLEAIETERWPDLEPHISVIDLAEGERLFAAGRESERLFIVVDGELGLDMPRTRDGARPTEAPGAADAGSPDDRPVDAPPDPAGGASRRADRDDDDLADADPPDDAPPDDPPVRLQVRGRGQTAGDFAVLNGGAHLVSAVATRRTRVAGFPRFAFERLTDIEPALLAHVYDTAATLSRRVTLARAFLDLFGALDAATLETLLDASSLHHYRSGETLFREGDEPDGLHIVVSGRLYVETRENGTEHRIAEVQAPESVGELALIAGTRRSASVYAARESAVARLGLDDFESLIAPRADLLMALSRLVVERHVARRRDGAAVRRDRNFVVVPLDSRLPLRRFLNPLRRALRRDDETLVLDARGFDTLYGKRGASATTFDDPFNGAVAEWLDEQENRVDSLVYVADGTDTPWTLRALNRGDRVLLLASATPDADPARRRIERQVDELFAGRDHRPRIDLVLLHPPDSERPSGTRHWLAPRRVDAFHHVRLDDGAHFERLARRLSGRARAIVFSGGGARGYAHLGVQRLIEEEGIAIDCIGGSSMGALLGASFALGDDAAHVTRLSARFANRRALFDYTLPLTSLMRSRKLERFCREVYGEQRIEDLWTPYFCLSSNLADGREVVHDRGPLWEAVRATISLPGIFSPVPTPSGDLLIDGAVLNTFPVDVMHARLAGAGNIIGVNVSEVAERFDYYDYGTSLSGWHVLLSRLNPFRPRIRNPRIAETLLRSTDIKGISRLNEARAMLEVLIEPDVSEVALLDFKAYAAIADIGYRAAREVFARHGLCEACETDGTDETGKAARSGDGAGG